MLTRQSYTYAQRESFRRLFDKDIQDYWDGMFGLDIIKFGEDIWPGGEEQEGSLRDFILEKYGQEAVDLIESFL